MVAKDRLRKHQSVYFQNNEHDLPIFRNFLHSEESSQHHKRLEDEKNPTALDVFAFLRALAEGGHLNQLAHLRLDGSSESDKERMALIEALRRLMNPPWTPWWKRIWVVQEIIMPGDATMLYGSVSAPWNIFEKAASSFEFHSSTCCADHANNLPRDLTGVLIDFSNKVHDIEELRSAHKSKSQEMPLLKLLQKFRSREASDLRDKVYALIGLVENGPNIVPNYFFNDRQVYTKTTLEIIHSTKSYAILSTDAGRKFRNDLPSWVPDWAAPGAQSTAAVHLYEVTGAIPFENTQHLSPSDPRSEEDYDPIYSSLHYELEWRHRVVDSDFRKAVIRTIYSGIPTSLIPEKPKFDPFILTIKAAPRAKVTDVGEVMWGDSAEVIRKTILSWWLAVAYDASHNITRFWELICAEILKNSNLPGGFARRTTPFDEITFLSWAHRSLKSPFRSYSRQDIDKDWKVWKINEFIDHDWELERERQRRIDEFISRINRAHKLRPDSPVRNPECLLKA